MGPAYRRLLLTPGASRVYAGVLTGRGRTAIGVTIAAGLAAVQGCQIQSVPSMYGTHTPQYVPSGISVPNGVCCPKRAGEVVSHVSSS